MQAEPRDHAGVLLPPPLLYALPLVAGLLVHGAVPLHFLPAEWQLGPGAPVMALSLGLVA